MKKQLLICLLVSLNLYSYTNAQNYVEDLNENEINELTSVLTPQILRKHFPNLFVEKLDLNGKRNALTYIFKLSGLDSNLQEDILKLEKLELDDMFNNVFSSYIDIASRTVAVTSPIDIARGAVSITGPSIDANSINNIDDLINSQNDFDSKVFVEDLFNKGILK